MVGLVNEAGSELRLSEPVSFSKMSTGPAHCVAGTVWPPAALKVSPEVLKQFTRLESLDGSVVEPPPLFST